MPRMLDCGRLIARRLTKTAEGGIAGLTIESRNCDSPLGGNRLECVKTPIGMLLRRTLRMNFKVVSSIGYEL